MVDIKAKPFNLSDEDCKWVEDTIASMDVDEKIGQLFFNMGSSRTEGFSQLYIISLTGAKDKLQPIAAASLFAI